MGEIIECKICGKKINSNALPLHLYNKHNKMKVKEYRERYENNNPENKPVTRTEKEPEIRIRDVEWLNKKTGYVALFENMETIEPVAIGMVAVDGEEVPSLLILNTDGRLIPPWFIAGFRGLYTRKEANRIMKRLKVKPFEGIAGLKERRL